MLIECNRATGTYIIALNNASNGAELVSDFSYLTGAPCGVLTFDLTHMAAGLTQEMRDEYLPGSFGFQPTISLLEIVSTLGSYVEQQTTPSPHSLVALLPNQRSRVGRFLIEMGIPPLLASMNISVSFANPANAEVGRDDTTRKNLIPLTLLHLSSGTPNFTALEQVVNHVEHVFTEALPGASHLVGCFTTLVEEAIDNLLEYGDGGIIGGLYYPNSGEVEVTLVNRHGGFGGTTPEEELDALVVACEGKTQRKHAGGTGIAKLSRLTLACFGTLFLRNGNAALRLLPDGSMVATADTTGFSYPGAYITLLLQLLPTTLLTRTEEMRQFEAVLEPWLQTYSRTSSRRMN